jgi:hypothetical protein
MIQDRTTRHAKSAGSNPRPWTLACCALTLGLCALASNRESERRPLIAAPASILADFSAHSLCRRHARLARLEVIDKNLSIDKYTLVFIGTVGEGKTTAICHLFNLLGEFSASKIIGGKARTIKETQELLATGSGRRTICEVLLRAGERTYMEVVPFSTQEMESMILDFCDSLSDPSDVQGEPRAMLSKEVRTAIRNVIQLPEETVTSKDGDKPARSRIDRAKEELEKSGKEGLKAVAIRNANLAARTETRISYSGDEDERAWIKRTFARLNDGEVPTVAIPRKIVVCVNESILSGSALSQF